MLHAILLALLMLVTSPTHATVVEQTYEGYSQYNDYYIVEVKDKDFYYEVEADDLDVGDEVTLYFFGDTLVKVVYGWR